MGMTGDDTKITYRNCDKINPEIAVLAKFIIALRKELDRVERDRPKMIETFRTWAKKEGRTEDVEWCDTLKAQNHKLIISYTPRFNAFICSSEEVGFSRHFMTDGEGLALYKALGTERHCIDYVNLMIYDEYLPEGMDYMTFYQNVCEATAKVIGWERLVAGFEFGIQGGASKERPITGEEAIEIVSWLGPKGCKGIMVWSINKADGTDPEDLVTPPEFITHATAEFGIDMATGYGPLVRGRGTARGKSAGAGGWRSRGGHGGGSTAMVRTRAPYTGQELKEDLSVRREEDEYGHTRFSVSPKLIGLVLVAGIISFYWYRKRQEKKAVLVATTPPEELSLLS